MFRLAIQITEMYELDKIVNILLGAFRDTYHLRSEVLYGKEYLGMQRNYK